MHSLSTDSTLLGLSIFQPPTPFHIFQMVWLGVLWIGSLWRQPGWRPEQHSFLMLFGSGRDHRRPLLSTDSARVFLSVSLAFSVCGMIPLVIQLCIRWFSFLLKINMHMIFFSFKNLSSFKALSYLCCIKCSVCGSFLSHFLCFILALFLNL